MTGPNRRIVDQEDQHDLQTFSGEFGDSKAEAHPNGADPEVRTEIRMKGLHND